MSTAIIVVVVIVVIVAVAAVAVTARRRRLQRQFGPEYDRAVEEQQSKLRADAALSDRQRRVRKLDIKPLSDEARSRYLADWMAVQEKFVDSPQSAVTDAYALVTTVMKERGYPTEDDEQVLADLSVEHAQTVGHFRSAREITVNVASGDAATEDLRQALIHYRALFSDLLGGPADELPGTATDTPADTVPADTATPVDTVPADSATPVDTVPADTVAADGATPVDTAPADMVAADAVTPADTAPAGPVADTDQDDLVTETPAEARAEASPR